MVWRVHIILKRYNKLFGSLVSRDEEKPDYTKPAFLNILTNKNKNSNEFYLTLMSYLFNFAYYGCRIIAW